jgi:hypothetical protein
VRQEFRSEIQSCDDRTVLGGCDGYDAGPTSHIQQVLPAQDFCKPHEVCGCSGGHEFKGDETGPRLFLTLFELL